MAKNILVVGMNPVWQRIIFLPKLELGRVNRANNIMHVSSGKGLNYSKVLKRLGAEPILAGFAGGDRGVKFIKGANKLDIESVFIQTEDTTRSCTTLISEDPHLVTEIIDPSPIISSVEAESLLGKIREISEECGVLVICGTHPNGIKAHIYKEILACFKDKLTVMDSYIDIEAILESKPKVIKVNLREICSITGEKDPDLAAKVCFHKYGVESLGITNGRDNAYLYTAKAKYIYHMPTIAVRNSIGAGDAVGAGMLYKRFLEHREMDEAFHYGLACGLASCETDLPSDFHNERALELLDKIEIDRMSWKLAR